MCFAKGIKVVLGILSLVAVIGCGGGSDGADKLAVDLYVYDRNSMRSDLFLLSIDGVDLGRGTAAPQAFGGGQRYDEELTLGSHVLRVTYSPATTHDQAVEYDVMLGGAAFEDGSDNKRSQVPSGPGDYREFTIIVQ